MYLFGRIIYCEDCVQIVPFLTHSCRYLRWLDTVVVYFSKNYQFFEWLKVVPFWGISRVMHSQCIFPSLTEVSVIVRKLGCLATKNKLGVNINKTVNQLVSIKISLCIALCHGIIQVKWIFSRLGTCNIKWIKHLCSLLQ